MARVPQHPLRSSVATWRGPNPPFPWELPRLSRAYILTHPITTRSGRRLQQQQQQQQQPPQQLCVSPALLSARSSFRNQSASQPVSQPVSQVGQLVECCLRRDDEKNHFT
jgi:hypothetical protein